MSRFLKYLFFLYSPTKCLIFPFHQFNFESIHFWKANNFAKSCSTQSYLNELVTNESLRTLHQQTNSRAFVDVKGFFFCNFISEKYVELFIAMTLMIEEERHFSSCDSVKCGSTVKPAFSLWTLDSENHISNKKNTRKKLWTQRRQRRRVKRRIFKLLRWNRFMVFIPGLTFHPVMTTFEIESRGNLERKKEKSF